jgi:hypothetical protein
MYSRRTTQKQLENVLRLQEQHKEEMKKKYGMRYDTFKNNNIRTFPQQIREAQPTRTKTIYHRSYNEMDEMEKEKFAKDVLRLGKANIPSLKNELIKADEAEVRRIVNLSKQVPIPRHSDLLRVISKSKRDAQIQLHDDKYKKLVEEMEFGGGRRNPTKSKHADMNMKDIKRLCKANQIKLSKTKDGIRVIYTKKELITKLKRKKIL